MLKFNNDFLAAICRLGHRHPFFAPKFLPVKWNIKVTKILYKILTLNNPKWCCAIFTSTSQTIYKNLYYEVDPGPDGKFILRSGPWITPPHYFPTDVVPVQWILSALHKFCFPNKLFRGVENTAADSNTSIFNFYTVSDPKKTIV